MQGLVQAGLTCLPALWGLVESMELAAVGTASAFQLVCSCVTDGFRVEKNAGRLPIR